MQGLDNVAIDEHFRTRVQLLVGRLGRVELVAPRSWRDFAARLGVDDSTVESSSEHVPLVIGPPAHVLKHAASGQGEFGFISPVAQIARPWSRSGSWRDDLTLELWKIGWTPIDLDRLLVTANGMTLEFLVANARPTPRSAFEDTD